MISYRNKKSEEKRYLICFPHGGINDMLTRISQCYNYCLKYNRILVIDSSYDWFKEDIRDYINFNSPIIYKGELNKLYDKLNKETTYPPEFKGILNNRFNFKYSPGGYIYNNTTIINNLSRDYTEIVKLFVGCSDGRIININLLKECSFKPLVINIFRDRYDKLPKDYISVHIRNTDKLSNVDEFLNKYKEEIIGKSIFLATDHAPTIVKFKEIFGSNLYSFATIPDNNGKSIHYNHKSVPRRQFNIDCFVDLLLLASGSKVYLSSIINLPYIISGYGRLAMILHNNKDLLRQLTA
jgi:hypothetical protein